MAEFFNSVNPDSWRGLKLDSTVTLRDEQTIQEMLDQGDGGDLSQGRDYFVKAVITIREINKAAEWILFELDAPRDDDSIWLVVKIADKDLTLSVYFAAEDNEQDNYCARHERKPAKRTVSVSHTAAIHITLAVHHRAHHGGVRHHAVSDPPPTKHITIAAIGGIVVHIHVPTVHGGGSRYVVRPGSRPSRILRGVLTGVLALKRFGCIGTARIRGAL